MYELPLFPLNTVLFPGTPLHLHIFEERYKKMIATCLDEGRPFGVVLIQRGAQALGALAEPHEIGCTARILQTERLEGGRSNIVALGGERFRILSLDRQSQPYLVGRVEDYPMRPPSEQAVRQDGERLRAQVRRYVSTLIQAGGVDFDLQQLPVSPLSLAYMAAAILQLSPARKQDLLALEYADDLLMSLRVYYRRELALLNITLQAGGGELPGGFSQN